MSKKVEKYFNIWNLSPSFQNSCGWNFLAIFFAQVGKLELPILQRNTEHVRNNILQILWAPYPQSTETAFWSRPRRSRSQCARSRRGRRLSGWRVSTTACGTYSKRVRDCGFVRVFCLFVGWEISIKTFLFCETQGALKESISTVIRIIRIMNHIFLIGMYDSSCERSWGTE